METYSFIRQVDLLRIYLRIIVSVLFNIFWLAGLDQDQKQVGGKRRITAKQFYVYPLQEKAIVLWQVSQRSNQKAAMATAWL